MENILKPITVSYDELKSKYPDAVILMRVGDFYETYKQDAQDASEILGLTLTKMNTSGVYTCGFPFHALDVYLPKLIRAGKRVAICDPM
jgi:DNA mismatch repair protein MutS